VLLLGDVLRQEQRSIVGPVQVVEHQQQGHDLAYTLEELAHAVEGIHALLLGRQLDEYRLEALLGHGGMATVYLAHDLALDRKVAIKVLPEAVAKDPERLARFRREAQLLASLNHPRIAAIYGLEEAGGAEALVLELVEGEAPVEEVAAVTESGEPAGPAPTTTTSYFSAMSTLPSPPALNVLSVKRARSRCHGRRGSESYFNEVSLCPCG